jgi:hypothetical protein
MSPAQSHGLHQKWIVNPPLASKRGDRTLVTLGEMKHRFFMVVLVTTIVMATTGWVYALGWFGLKLIYLII